jgi:hypothetical protein
LVSEAPSVDVKSCCVDKEHRVDAASSSKSIVTRVVADEPQTVEQGLTYLLGWRALACRGQSLNWLAAVPALIRLHSDLAAPAPCIAWLGRIPSEHAGRASAAPLVPPPELA